MLASNRPARTVVQPTCVTGSLEMVLVYLVYCRRLLRCQALNHVCVLMLLCVCKLNPGELCMMCCSIVWMVGCCRGFDLCKSGGHVTLLIVFARPLRIRGKALESPPEQPTFRYLVVHGRATTAQEWTKRRPGPLFLSPRVSNIWEEDVCRYDCTRDGVY